MEKWSLYPRGQGGQFGVTGQRSTVGASPVVDPAAQNPRAGPLTRPLAPMVEMLSVSRLLLPSIYLLVGTTSGDLPLVWGTFLRLLLANEQLKLASITSGHWLKSDGKVPRSR